MRSEASRVGSVMSGHTRLVCYVSNLFSPEGRGFENIIRLDTTFTVRVHGHHAIALKYILSHREAHYPDLGDRHQTMGTVGLYYTWIGDKEFGAVEWRDASVH